MHAIDSPPIPATAGHYSPAIAHNGTLYISGQLPVDPEDKSIPPGIEDQTDLTLQKIDQILLAAGTDRSRIIQVRVYISDVKLWAAVNQRYAVFFGDHKPARCVVPTGPLHYGCLIEIEALAAIDG